MRKVFYRCLIGYCILTAPLTVVFLKDAYFRLQFFAYLTRQANKVRPPKYVFIGDSITAGGLNWGLKLDRNPVAATVFGLHGFQTHQLVPTAKDVAALRPSYIHVLAGTNDALAEKEAEAFARDFRELIGALNPSGATIVVTLVPYQRDLRTGQLIERYNAAIELMKEEFHYRTLDLNPVIAPDGMLLPRFSEDGIHFSPQAYEVWTKKLKPLLSMPRPN